MALTAVVLDFDGTFTDLEKESAPFPDALQSALSDLLGRDVRPAWARAQATIESRPAEFGWNFEGKVVAPSTADPYLLGTAVVQELLNEAGVLKDPALRTTVVQALYGVAYEKTVTCFKPTALQTLNALLALGPPVTVVTNSKTDAVARKLDQLGLARRAFLPVKGEAKKFWVTGTAAPGFTLVPEVENSPELPNRPIYLRRGKYFEALQAVWKDAGATAQDTLVVGDIYELDLALPASLGCKVALVESAHTQRYERERVAAHGGTVLRDVYDAVALAKSLV